MIIHNKKQKKEQGYFSLLVSIRLIVYFLLVLKVTVEIIYLTLFKKSKSCTSESQ